MYSIVIVDYKSAQRTLEYIKDLYDKSKQPSLINFIVVDNSESGDACLEYNKKGISYKSFKQEMGNKIYNCFEYTLSYIKFIVIATKENMGYARGNNIGASFSQLVYQDTYIIFSNNDLRLKKEIDWSKYDEFFKDHPDCAMLGPTIKNKIDDSNANPLKKNSLFEELFLYYYDCITMHKFKNLYNFVDDKNKGGVCDAVAGSFVVCSKEKFFNVGMYDLHTFLYYEEHIISERIRKKGYSCYYYNNNSGIVHEHGVTTEKHLHFFTGDSISFKSRMYYAEKYRGAGEICLTLANLNYYVIFLPLALMKRIVKMIIISIKGGR